MRLWQGRATIFLYTKGCEHQMLKTNAGNMSLRFIMVNADEIYQLNGFLHVIFRVLQVCLLDGIWKEVFLLLELPSLGIGIRPQTTIEDQRFTGRCQLCNLMDGR